VLAEDGILYKAFLGTLFSFDKGKPGFVEISKTVTEFI